MTSDRDAHKTRGDKAEGSVTRLEKLCNLRGIDPNTVVPASTAPGSAATNVVERYKELQEQENKGEIANGTAFKFYRKNKKEIDAATSAD
jgi:hypothetical protein